MANKTLLRAALASIERNLQSHPFPIDPTWPRRAHYVSLYMLRRQADEVARFLRDALHPDTPESGQGGT